ncbi:hypothetical protein BS50DRAFT_542624 [Corynespora cassiicola Philippines]|uniref:Uncharacterized protein n=1 Tax=Corynespora cassiicola Philippines TaxID=1448308 RepID=A0A2T2P6J9_CORCC|nr:hypothetical protein BS50DRAFT_542624 [Corynespora cassiicola Philippines]
MSYAYKVEELLALRDSISESAVSIDKFADEDVIKAERLLKEHGSPPGMRVTAGGRVVPSDLPPLATARFVNNSFKSQPLRGITSDGTMSAQPQPDINTLGRIQMIGNQPVICVGDKMFALPAVSTNNSTFTAGVANNMDAVSKQILEPGMVPTQVGLAGVQYAPSRSNAQTPFAGLDLPGLRAQQALRKQELRAVEQQEVLQASSQGDAWRAGMIEKKRNLIMELDNLRKHIMNFETDNAVPASLNNFPNSLGSTIAPVPPPSFVPQFQQPISQSMYAYPASGAYPPLLMYPTAFGGFQNMPATDSSQFLQHTANAPHSPESVSRRSHAIEIKPPRDDDKKQVTSALDPKSPTYEPVVRTNTAAIKEFIPPTPSPAKHSPWRSDDAAQPDKHGALPSTPEKHWPASPWNEGNSCHSGTGTIAKLGPWPDSFGKQPSLSSLKSATPGQDRAPLATADIIKSAFASSVSSRKINEHRTETDENWPMNPKPTHHRPSTYQEGFQAGYDHVGIPDIAEVLQGYIQGIMQFLSDESRPERFGSLSTRKSSLPTPGPHTSALRAVLAGSMPHDSAISMSFNRGDGSIGTQENARSGKSRLMTTDVRKEFVSSPHGTALEATLPYMHRSEAPPDTRPRHSSATTFLSPMEPSDRAGTGFRHIGTSTAELDINEKHHDKGSLPRSVSSVAGTAYPRQISGNQLGSRFSGAPMAMQRYYPTVKDYSRQELSGEIQTYTRPLANHRLSGLDGAMDDLADLIVETGIVEQQPQTQVQTQTQTRSQTQMDAVSLTEQIEADASCFKPSSSKTKGKQKVTSPPAKSASAKSKEAVASPTTSPPTSPKKSGEHSPAKAKLEKVTNRFRHGRKDDPRRMSPAEKRERSQKWQARFKMIKQVEREEIDEYRSNHARK